MGKTGKIAALSVMVCPFPLAVVALAGWGYMLGTDPAGNWEQASKGLKDGYLQLAKDTRQGKFDPARVQMQQVYVKEFAGSFPLAEQALQESAQLAEGVPCTLRLEGGDVKDLAADGRVLRVFCGDREWDCVPGDGALSYSGSWCFGKPVRLDLKDAAGQVLGGADLPTPLTVFHEKGFKVELEGKEKKGALAAFRSGKYKLHGACALTGRGDGKTLPELFPAFDAMVCPLESRHVRKYTLPLDAAEIKKGIERYAARMNCLWGGVFAAGLYYIFLGGFLAPACLSGVRGLPGFLRVQLEVYHFPFRVLWAYIRNRMGNGESGTADFLGEACAAGEAVSSGAGAVAEGMASAGEAVSGALEGGAEAGSFLGDLLDMLMGLLEIPLKILSAIFSAIARVFRALFFWLD